MRRPLASLLVVIAISVLACARHEPPGASTTASAEPSPSAVTDEDALAPLAVASAEGDDDGPDDAGAPVDGGSDVPSGPAYEPVENGAFKLAAIATQTWVYAGPNDETPKLGYLRAGAVVDRGERPVAFTKRCKKGWFRVFPRGFVCNGRRATIDPDNPIVVASWKRPRRGDPLPYRYGRSKEVAPILYVRVPTAKEMERAETMKLAERLRLVPKESMLSLAGEIEPIPPFLQDGKTLPKPFGAPQRLQIGPHEGRAGQHSAFAIMSVHEIENRLFGLTTDLDLVPLDRLNLVRLTDIHGGEIQDLPAGIVISFGAPRYKLDPGGSPREDGKLEKWSTVSLTGVTRGDLWETRDGYWVSAQTVKLLRKRSQYPSFVRADAPQKKWVDVSIHEQTLVAYEGEKAVYATLVSTGIGEMGDPEKTHATKRGTFTIKAKHVTATMNGDESVDDYELADVPYVQYFENGFALHAAFWHERFGHPYSHGCVNLPPRDAAWLFEWTDPPVPKDWHGAQAIAGDGTVVNVRY